MIMNDDERAWSEKVTRPARTSRTDQAHPDRQESMMTADIESRDQTPDPDHGGPGDVPAGRPASLDRLDGLIGEWDMEASFEAGYFGPGSPALTAGGGQTTFEWLEGRFFLTQRFVNEHPDAPSGIALIGAGAEPASFVQRYYDSRGVERVYQMTLDGGLWKLWREAPGFCQRYTGQISDDGDTITGAWEFSPDGQAWRHDFGLTYLRRSSLPRDGAAQ